VGVTTRSPNSFSVVCAGGAAEPQRCAKRVAGLQRLGGAAIGELAQALEHEAGEQLRLGEGVLALGAGVVVELASRDRQRQADHIEQLIASWAAARTASRRWWMDQRRIEQVKLFLSHAPV
jgi:hypothetical protein